MPDDKIQSLTEHVTQRALNNRVLYRSMLEKTDHLIEVREAELTELYALRDLLKGELGI